MYVKLFKWLFTDHQTIMWGYFCSWVIAEDDLARLYNNSPAVNLEIFTRPIIERFFLSFDYSSIGSQWTIPGGWHVAILEQFEIFKMAAIDVKNT